MGLLFYLGEKILQRLICIKVIFTHQYLLLIRTDQIVSQDSAN